MRSISGFTSIYCKSYAGLIFLQSIELGQSAPCLESRGMDLSKEDESSDPTVFFQSAVAQLTF